MPLPADVVRAAKDIMLGGIGVMLAGSQEEPAHRRSHGIRDQSWREVRRAATEWPT
jgi:hypothetical protein